VKITALALLSQETWFPFITFLKKKRKGKKEGKTERFEKREEERM